MDGVVEEDEEEGLGENRQEQQAPPQRQEEGSSDDMVEDSSEHSAQGFRDGMTGNNDDDGTIGPQLPPEGVVDAGGVSLCSLIMVFQDIISQLVVEEREVFDEHEVQ